VDDIRIVANLAVSVAARADQITIPAAFALAPNYPNPFSPRGSLGPGGRHTTIRFALPAIAQIDIAIYDLLGRRVATLLNEKRPAGVHLVRWEAQDEAGQQVAAGIYFYRLQATLADGRRAFQSVRKMVVQ